MTKQIRSILTLAFAACLCSTLASAQRGPDVFFGVGTATDSRTGPVDTFRRRYSLQCSEIGWQLRQNRRRLYAHQAFRIGAETDFRFGQSPYAGVQTRPVFYDFNGIFTPTFGRFKTDCSGIRRRCRRGPHGV